MFRSGAEMMFTGDQGAAAYMFFVMLVTVALAAIAGAKKPEGSTRGRPGSAVLMAGAVLAALARTAYFWSLPSGGILSAALILSAITGFGLLLRYASARVSGLLFRVVMILQGASTALLALSAAGLTGSGSLWIQLFAVTDVAASLLYLVMVAADGNFAGAGQSALIEAPAYTPLETERGEETESSGPAADISGMILRGDREQDIYREIASASMKGSGADFVIIRMYSPEDDKFPVKGHAGEMIGGGIPQFATSASRSRVAELCESALSNAEGAWFTRDDLGEDAEAFVPMAVEWGSGSLLIYPVIDGGGFKGFFTAVFFDEKPQGDAGKVFPACARSVLALMERESLKERVRKAEKGLALCREELEAANQLKTNFLSIVSHELRTPLTSIKAYAETLLDNVKTIDRETIANFLHVMGEENDRVIKLVDNMLNYSSMETGHLKVEKVTCSLNALISESIEEIDGDFIARKVNRDIRLPRKEVFIEADRELIKQLLHNLVSNAIKFTPEMGKVSITLSEEASAARITVQDTGRGVPEDQLERIFERFHQVDASDTREYGGSGLGLAICKNIVEWHDGKIWVENVMEAGARFVVMLPMKDIVVRQAVTSGQIGSVRFERERYLSLLVEMVSEFLQAKKASIMVLDSDRKYLHVVAAKGLDPEFVQNTRVEVGDRISGKVFLEGESVYVFDIERDRNLRRANNSAYYGTNSFISSPMRDGDEVIGVLNVSDHVDGREFTKSDMEILEALSQVISGMMKKLEAYQTVSMNFDRLKEAMKSILGMRESWGSRNLNNYTLIAMAVGDRLGLDERSMTALRMGMNMYDLGMMKVPRSIRVKKEELSAKEWSKLRSHTDLGFGLLSPMGLNELILKMVRFHHENFDGSGYPEGLAREEIPVEARILNVIDSFRALITPGPYRRCFTIEEARNEILRGSGSRFDPKVVGAFLKSLTDLGARQEEADLVLDAVEEELERIRKEQEYSDPERDAEEKDMTVKEEV